MLIFYNHQISIDTFLTNVYIGQKYRNTRNLDLTKTLSPFPFFNQIYPSLSLFAPWPPYNDDDFIGNGDGDGDGENLTRQ